MLWADRRLFEKWGLANIKAFKGEEKEGAEAVAEVRRWRRLSRGTPGKVLNGAETTTVLSAYLLTVPYN